MTERFYLSPIVTSVGGKTWFRHEAWLYYSRACKSRDSDMRWVDPFCGGMAIPLYILPNDAWLNDFNIHLVNFYRQVISVGKMRHMEEDINEERYYQIRNKFNENIKSGNTETLEMAEMYYYLNKVCYGGLSRYNDSGLFNAPYGKANKPSMKQDLQIYKDVLSDWKITCLNYSDVLDQVEENDFLFIDPPYHQTFNKYIKRSFTWEDQVKIVESLSKLNNPILATNSYNEQVIDLYTSNGFHLSHRYRKNNFQQARADKARSEKFKEAIFVKNITID